MRKNVSHALLVAEPFMRDDTTAACHDRSFFFGHPWLECNTDILHGVELGMPDQVGEKEPPVDGRVHPTEEPVMKHTQVGQFFSSVLKLDDVPAVVSVTNLLHTVPVTAHDVTPVVLALPLGDRLLLPVQLDVTEVFDDVHDLVEDFYQLLFLAFFHGAKETHKCAKP